MRKKLLYWSFVVIGIGLGVLTMSRMLIPEGISLSEIPVAAKIATFVGIFGVLLALFGVSHLTATTVFLLEVKRGSNITRKQVLRRLLVGMMIFTSGVAMCFYYWQWLILATGG